MAQLLLPIILKTENLFYHDVCAISSSITYGDQVIVTGSLGGEIVIWKVEQKTSQQYQLSQVQQQQVLYMMVPQLFLKPSLNQQEGHVTFLAIIQKPLKEILVSQTPPRPALLCFHQRLMALPPSPASRFNRQPRPPDSPILPTDA